jgi:talin
LDEKTKEILKTWPLTTVKRWAASPNVFTLDFGDYQDQYYSVQTTEGEHISALIAGYIDIILKRRQRKERFGEDGNEEEAMEESFISPGRAIEIHGLPQTLKKAKPDSLAHPGVFRNSGPQEINFNGHSSSQKSIVTNGHQNGGFDTGVGRLFVCFPSLHACLKNIGVSNHFQFCDLTNISSFHCSSSLECAYHSMYPFC